MDFSLYKKIVEELLMPVIQDRPVCEIDILQATTEITCMYINSSVDFVSKEDIASVMKKIHDTLAELFDHPIGKIDAV